jgi:energy-coupling factor transporter ATP-binding protein EcfA2
MLRPLAEIISEMWREANMPSINRQSPPQRAATFPPGSVLAGAVPVTSLREEHIRMCVYGRNRSGKTTLAAMIAQAAMRKTGKQSLIISAEPDENGGAISISDVEGIVITRITPPNRPIKGDKVKGTAKIVAIAAELEQSNPFAWVFLDTITSLQDIHLVELMGLPKVPEILSWGMVPDGVYQQRAEKLRETVRPLLGLTNCNVCILAQEKDHNAPEDRGGKSKLLHTMQQGSFMAPALGATNAQWLQDACGYVIQIYEDEVMQDIVVPQMDAHGNPMPPVVQSVGTGKRARHLRLLYHPNFAAGGRWKYDRNMPEYVTASDPRGLYEAMAAYIPALR